MRESIGLKLDEKLSSIAQIELNYKLILDLDQFDYSNILIPRNFSLNILSLFFVFSKTTRPDLKYIYIRFPKLFFDRYE